MGDVFVFHRAIPKFTDCSNFSRADLTGRIGAMVDEKNGMDQHVDDIQ